MDQSVSLPTYEAKVAWADQIPGVFTVGYSQVGGPDTLGEEFPQYTYTGPYDDLSPRMLTLSYQRGRSDDLTEVSAGQGSLEVVDAEEVFNPHNRDSPIVSQLVPLRPYRIRAKGPKLVRLTTNGWQMDDAARSRSLNGDDFEQALLRKKPLAYWRLNEEAGSMQYWDAAGDPDAFAYPEGGALARADSLVAGDPGYGQTFGGSAYLIANHTDTINPRATFTAIAVFKLTQGGPACIAHKPDQWSLQIDSGNHLTFEYQGTDYTVVADPSAPDGTARVYTTVSVRSVPSLAVGTPYLAVMAWDGKMVRMWLNRDEVGVVRG